MLTDFINKLYPAHKELVLRKISKVDKPPARLTEKKRENTDDQDGTK